MATFFDKTTAPKEGRITGTYVRLRQFGDARASLGDIDLLLAMLLMHG